MQLSVIENRSYEIVALILHKKSRCRGGFCHTFAVGVSGALNQSERMLSTGFLFAMPYTGRKVAIMEVITAIPSITSQERGPNTKMDAPKTPATSRLSIGQRIKHAAIASAKQMTAMIADSE